MYVKTTYQRVKAKHAKEIIIKYVNGQQLYGLPKLQTKIGAQQSSNPEANYHPNLYFENTVYNIQFSCKTFLGETVF